MYHSQDRGMMSGALREWSEQSDDRLLVKRTLFGVHPLKSCSVGSRDYLLAKNRYEGSFSRCVKFLSVRFEFEGR